jgi:tetratricopeptide (TPR) repeat protein
VRLVSITGPGGIGKSRLVWELEKYIDGVAEDIYWHRGRSPSYGEGVTFWALGEMVRRRAELTEDDDEATTRRRIEATLVEHVPDASERERIGPALLCLLGLDEGSAGGRETLFPAWRLLFERIAEKGTTVLVFEDLQWADSGLLDFIDHLLDWSRGLPILVVTLARPELFDRRPDWGANRRHLTAMALEPLTDDAVRQLLNGLVPGLPHDALAAIVGRAEGVPLYAVETVRMLLDRGLLVEEGGVYRPTGTVGDLEVPETLQGLIAARLDGLGADERRLLQDASVLGKTFTKEALAAVSGLSKESLAPLLTSLVRKEVLGVQADPRSPERGQYGFLQDLVRRVAYDTLSRRDRKTRHLAAAAHLEESFGSAEHEIVEVVAAHYLAAFEAQPDAEDAPQIKADARELLARAGERAGSLAALGEARRYFEQAAELVDEPLEKARLLEQTGLMAFRSTEYEQAEQAFLAALGLLERAGETHAVARVSGRMAHVESETGRSEQAIERLERAFAAVAGDEPDADVAELAARLGQAYMFAGDFERSVAPTELALRAAQAQRLPEALVPALLTKSLLARADSRPEEELALMRHAIRYALENDVPELANQAYTFLSDACFFHDRYLEALDVLREALALARRVGIRRRELFVLSETSYTLAMTGGWQEALAAFAELPEEQFGTSPALSSVLSGVLEIHLHRGDLEAARALFSLFDYLEGAIDVQDRAIHSGAWAALAYAEGESTNALSAGTEAAGFAQTLGAGQQGVKQGLVWAVEAALALGERERADELLTTIEQLPPGLRPPFLEAQANRFRARMNEDETGFKTAAASFREYNFPFWLAVTQLEHGEWLRAQDRAAEAEPLLAEAREIFERLEATPWLERAQKVGEAAKMPA